MTRAKIDPYGALANVSGVTARLNDSAQVAPAYSVRGFGNEDADASEAASSRRDCPLSPRISKA